MLHFVARAAWRCRARPGVAASGVDGAGSRRCRPGAPRRSPRGQLAQPVLDAGPGQPPIIARSAWAQGPRPPAAARSTARSARVRPPHATTPTATRAPRCRRCCWRSSTTTASSAASSTSPTTSSIDAFGRIWEARAGGIDEPVIGAHAGGYNAVSTGVAVLGTFMSVVPPPAAIGSLERLLAWKLALHGVPALGKVTVVVDPADAFYTPFAPGRPRAAAAGRRPPRRRPDRLPRQRFYARLPGDPPADRRARGRARPVLTLAAASGAGRAGAALAVSGRWRSRTARRSPARRSRSSG